MKVSKNRMSLFSDLHQIGGRSVGVSVILVAARLPERFHHESRLFQREFALADGFAEPSLHRFVVLGRSEAERQYDDRGQQDTELPPT